MAINDHPTKNVKLAYKTAWKNDRGIGENSVKIDHVKSLLHCFLMFICVSRLAKWTLKLVNIRRYFTVYLERHLIECFLVKLNVVDGAFHDLKNSPEIIWALFGAFGSFQHSLGCDEMSTELGVT